MENKKVQIGHRFKNLNEREFGYISIILKGYLVRRIWWFKKLNPRELKNYNNYINKLGCLSIMRVQNFERFGVLQRGLRGNQKKTAQRAFAVTFRYCYIN